MQQQLLELIGGEICYGRVNPSMSSFTSIGAGKGAVGPKTENISEFQHASATEGRIPCTILLNFMGLQQFTVTHQTLVALKETHLLLDRNCKAV